MRPSVLPFSYKWLNLFCSRGHIMAAVTTIMNTLSFPAKCVYAQDREVQKHIFHCNFPTTQDSLPHHPGLLPNSRRGTHRLADAYNTPTRVSSINRHPVRAQILSSNQATWRGEARHKGTIHQWNENVLTQKLNKPMNDWHLTKIVRF